MLLDEYGFDVQGEAAALMNSLNLAMLTLVVQKFSFTDNPGGYLIKKKDKYHRFFFRFKKGKSLIKKLLYEKKN